MICDITIGLETNPGSISQVWFEAYTAQIQGEWTWEWRGKHLVAKPITHSFKYLNTKSRCSNKVERLDVQNKITTR